MLNIVCHECEVPTKADEMYLYHGKDPQWHMKWLCKGCYDTKEV